MTNYLIPSLGISKGKVHAIFYDCEKDVLLESCPVNLFRPSGQKNLTTIVFIWLTLNYKWFCSGVTPIMMQDFPNIPESNFFKLAGPCLEMYTKDVQRPVYKPCSKVGQRVVDSVPAAKEEPDRVRRMDFIPIIPDELDFKREVELEKKHQQIQRELSQLEDEDALRVATTAVGGPRENFKIEKKMTLVSSSDSDSAIEDRRSRDRKPKKKKKEKRSKHSRSPMKVKLRSPSPGLDSDERHRKHKKKMKAKKQKDNQSDSERSTESEHISPEFVKEKKRKRSKGRTKSRSSSRDRSRSYSPETRKSRKVEKKKKGKREEYSEKPHKDTSFERSRDTKNRTGTPASDYRDLSPEPEVVKKKKEKKKDRKKKERDLSVGKEEYERKHKKEKGERERERSESPV